MEREREWVAAEEEETAAEEVDSGLEVRRGRRRRGEMGREDDGAPPEEEAEEGGGGDQRSVYLDEDQGVWKCRHCIWTYQLSGPGIDHIQKHTGYCQAVMDVETLSQLGTYFDSPIEGIEFSHVISGMEIREVDHFINGKNKSLGNGKADFGTKELNNQGNVPVQEGIQNSKNARLENGSHLNLSSDKYNENGITRNELEIEENVQVRLVKTSKLEVTDIDLERVLDEQDTHDLYCPNCNSCITKRVILRKRKRTVQGIQYDAPPAKLQQVQHDLDANYASAEMTELDRDREPDVFRCLSCFSFFSPTECGFNIFRIFGKREGSENLQNSEQLPVKNMNWISSIFKPTTSIKKGSETGLPLPSESSETSMNIQPSPATSASGALNLEEDQITAGKNDAELALPGLSDIARGEQMGDLAQKDNHSSLFATESGATNYGQSQATVGKNDAEIQTCLPGESNANSVEQMEGQSQRDKHSTPAQSIAGDMIHGNLQTNMGEKHHKDIVYNDARLPLPRKDMLNFGEQIGDAAYIYNYSSTTTSISGVIVHEGQTDIGQKINGAFGKNDAEDIIQPVGMVKPIFPDGTSHITQSIHGSLPVSVVLPHGETQIYLGEQSAGNTERNNDWDVLKSIVYGGLIESITSLGVISSAAGTDASTLNIVALGLANLIGGLFVIAHDLSELGSIQNEATDENGKPVGRYWELLGRKANFRRHAVVAVITYLLAGLLPPVVYGFSFRITDNKEYKLIAVASASLACIALLAIGKAHVRPQKAYIKTLLYYLVLGISASGLSYVAGVMIDRLLKQLGLFDGSAAPPLPPSVMYRDLSSMHEKWSSY